MPSVAKSGRVNAWQLPQSACALADQAGRQAASAAARVSAFRYLLVIFSTPCAQRRRAIPLAQDQLVAVALLPVSLVAGHQHGDRTLHRVLHAVIDDG